jgi:hypothetical protein
MSFNYLTVGNGCSPAAALRELNLREFALPFDWIQSNVNALQNCFETNFEHFHKNLVFNYNKKRLVDFYGFEFPHDYPLCNMSDIDNSNNIIGEGLFEEFTRDNDKFITDNWYDFYDLVLEKYSRRIERFKNIINDTKPIIVLCKYSIIDVLKLQNLFLQYYNLNNIYFLNSSNEVFENDKIKNIDTEKNNIWNDIHVWKEGMDDIIKKIKY